MSDLIVPPDIAERVNRFETGRNGEDDTLYRAATDRTILVGVINRLNALRNVRSAASVSIDPDRLAKAMFEEGFAPFRSRSNAEGWGFDERYRRNARDLIAEYDRLSLSD
jgi:hypothetical protein